MILLLLFLEYYNCQMRKSSNKSINSSFQTTLPFLSILFRPSSLLPDLCKIVFSFATRKSSCVNARGIPTTAYQVLHLFPEVGYPPSRGTPLARSDWGVPEVGYPLARSDGGDPRWGTPSARSDRGYLPGQV